MAKKTYWTEVTAQHRPVASRPIAARYFSHLHNETKHFNSRRERDNWIEEQNAIIQSLKSDSEYISVRTIMS